MNRKILKIQGLNNQPKASQRRFEVIEPLWAQFLRFFPQRLVRRTSKRVSVPCRRRLDFGSFHKFFSIQRDYGRVLFMKPNSLKTSSAAMRGLFAFFRELDLMNKNLIISMTLVLGISGCSTIMKEYDKALLSTDEFDQSVKIKEVEPPPEPEAKEIVKEEDKKTSQKKPSKAKKNKKEQEVVEAPKEEPAAQPAMPNGKLKKHEPDLEDSEGFDGRRPLVDPFRVGEKAVYEISYFAVEAGRFTTEIKPFVEVNKRKSYHFFYSGKTTSVFSLFYAVDDTAEAFLDYETLVPYSYAIHVKESKQVKEVRNYFDFKKMTARTWEKVLKKGKKLETKDETMTILPYSQNVFTVAFYLRTFQLAVGKKIHARVAHDNQNMIMSAEVLRKETLKTPVGSFEAFVLKPTFELDGMFKPVGDIQIWLSADDRKILLRIESKIKIGTIVASLEELKK